MSAKIGQAKAFQMKWIKKDGKTLVRSVESIEDSLRSILVQIKESKAYGDGEALKDCKKRKLVEVVKKTTFDVKKGEKFALEIESYATDLTSAMLQDGSWEKLSFKEYNLNSKGLVPPSGYLHPLLKFKEEVRNIFLEMGFEEMPTNNYVESSFWNFDSLFQPQQHPARDAHDTFFIKGKENRIKID